MAVDVAAPAGASVVEVEITAEAVVVLPEDATAVEVEITVEAEVASREEDSVGADADADEIADEIVHLSIFNVLELTTISSASKNRTRQVWCRNSP